MTPAVVRYGPEPDQFAQLWQPARPATPPAVVVLVHGGYWRHRYRCDLMEPLAADLCARGYAVWNLEYRRTGGPGRLSRLAHPVQRSQHCRAVGGCTGLVGDRRGQPDRVPGDDRQPGCRLLGDG